MQILHEYFNNLFVFDPVGGEPARSNPLAAENKRRSGPSQRHGSVGAQSGVPKEEADRGPVMHADEARRKVVNIGNIRQSIIF